MLWVFSGFARLTTRSRGWVGKIINTITYLNNDDQLVSIVVFPVNTGFEGHVSRSGERESATVRGVTNPGVADAVCMK
jgi:hypothetical protein